MSYIPLIKKVKWVDLSDEHKSLRETIESDLKSACTENGNVQPIMLQGAFGIGKSTTLYYLFHYGWEVLKTPTFYLPLAKIVDKVKEEAAKTDSGKVENNQLGRIISRMINTEIETLRTQNWDEIYELDFPEFKGKDDSSKLSLSEYLKDFQPVVLDTKENEESGSLYNTVFSENVIKEAISSNRTPVLLVDEFESKFYELKRIVESSGGGVLRELFDEIVQTKPFMLVIGNGPASGYEVAKEKGVSGNNDSETAANRRLKTLQIPFPTVALLKRKFMKDDPNGYVNFIWWMSRCRPGHIQKLKDRIVYKSCKLYDSSDFIDISIFNEPIDESGEEVRYLKTKYLNNLNSYIFPIVKDLLLDFEPHEIKLEETYKEALKDPDNALNFYCNDELVNVEKELLPAMKDDICDYLKKCNSEGKYTSINYLKNLNKYFNYILTACSNSKGEMTFNTTYRDEEKALAETFLIPILELTYDFISQYEDSDDSVVKETKDFILDCTKFIERSVKNDTIPEAFPTLNGLFSGFKIGKLRASSDFYIQFSLRAVREIIEQPIGSPSLKYKDMDLEDRLSEVNIRKGILLANDNKDNRVVFIPILEDSMLDKYLLRLKDYIISEKEDLHINGKRTLRFVYLQQNEKIEQLIKAITVKNDEQIAVAKYQKLVFEDYADYQFNFGSQISDFIDSVAKIAIVGCNCNDITFSSNEMIISIKSVIDLIKDREWTKQKEVVRTIEHYEKLVCEGENSVLQRIEVDSRKKYDEALDNAICDSRDYTDNISCDFTKAYDATITDEMSKYIGLYYLLEKAKSKTEICETMKTVLQTVGSHSNSNRLFLSPIPETITKALYFDQISKIISSSESEKLIKCYDSSDKFIEHISTFTCNMKLEETGRNLSDLLTFMRDKLKDHWIDSYNQKMSYYGFSSGEMLMKLIYLDNYIKAMNFIDIRQQLDRRIKEKEQELLATRTKVSTAISSITEMLYSQKYAREHPEKMPFSSYVKDLQQISNLLNLCKRVLDEECTSIATLCIIWSIVWRIANISNSASTLAKQIEGIRMSLERKKTYIERVYQIPINSFYSDSLTAKLIGLNEQKNLGQVPRYDGNYCWYEFARFLTPKKEADAIFDANLIPAREIVIKTEDITTFNNCLQTIVENSNYKVRMDGILEICRGCQSEAQQYTKLLGFVKKLLNC